MTWIALGSGAPSNINEPGKKVAITEIFQRTENHSHLDCDVFPHLMRSILSISTPPTPAALKGLVGRKSLGKSATVSCGGSGSGGGRPVRAQAAAASAAAAERRGAGGSMAHDRSSDENWGFLGPFLAVNKWLDLETFQRREVLNIFFLNRAFCWCHIMREEKLQNTHAQCLLCHAKTDTFPLMAPTW